MKRSALCAVLGMFLFCGILCAQSAVGNAGNRNSRFRQENTEEWAKVQTELKQKYPKEFAEIEKLQATNLFAALQKMRELAEQKSVRTPGFNRRNSRGGERMSFGEGDSRRMRRGGGGMGAGFNGSRAPVEAGLRQKYPAEYAQIVKQRIQADRDLEALAKKANVKLPASMESAQLKLEALKLEGKYPAEFAEIEKLRQNDPFAAIRKTRELMEKAGIETPANPFSGRSGGFSANGNPNRNMTPSGAGPRANPMQKIQELRKQYPEEMKKLDELRRKDPQAYRRGVMDLMKKSEEAKKPAK